jgi:negative regulator of flagellin synthesis FlgM
MVIDTNNINSSGSAPSRKAAPLSSNTHQTPAPPPDVPTHDVKHNVVISAEAQNLSRLQAKIKALPDVNLERVAALKQAIAEGRFHINPERIAENMLNQEELLR